MTKRKLCSASSSSSSSSGGGREEEEGLEEEPPFSSPSSSPWKLQRRHRRKKERCDTGSTQDDDDDDDDDDTAAAAALKNNRQHANPFLPQRRRGAGGTEGEGDNDDDDEEEASRRKRKRESLEGHVIDFYGFTAGDNLNLNRRSSSSSSSSRRKAQQEESALHLVRYLEEGDELEGEGGSSSTSSSTTSCFASRDDVSLLLLPWAVRRIVTVVVPQNPDTAAAAANSSAKNNNSAKKPQRRRSNKEGGNNNNNGEVGSDGKKKEKKEQRKKMERNQVPVADRATGADAAFLPLKALLACLRLLQRRQQRETEENGGANNAGAKNANASSAVTAAAEDAILTQSTLFKLLPRLAALAIRPPGDDDDDDDGSYDGAEEEGNESGDDDEDDGSSSDGTGGSGDGMDVVVNGEGKDDDDVDGRSDDGSESYKTAEEEEIPPKADEVRGLAARAYLMLVGQDSDRGRKGDGDGSGERRLRRKFRPTLDVACRSVLAGAVVDGMGLSHLDANRRILSSYVADSIEADVLLGTLRFVRDVHVSRAGNPRTAFRLLAPGGRGEGGDGGEVFLALARAWMYFQDHDDGGMLVCEAEYRFDDDNGNGDDGGGESLSPSQGPGRAAQEAIYEILADGLFHPRHHVAGFRPLLAAAAKRGGKSNAGDNDNGKGAAAGDGEKQQQPEQQQDGTPKSPPRSPASAATATKASPSGGGGGFRCYQEELLSGLAACLSLPEELDHQGTATAGNQRNPVNDARDAVWLMPVLLRGFFENAAEWDRLEKGSSGGAKRRRVSASSSADELAKLQFRMFARFASMLRAMIDAAGKLGERNVVAVASHALSESLKLVLRYNSYLPTQDDRERTHFGVLDTITSELLESQDSTVGAVSPGGGSSLGISRLSDALVGLRQLVLLDHRLLHDRLVSLFVFCAQCNDPRLHSLAVALLSTVTDSYRQLRQQSHLFMSLLGLVDGSARVALPGACKLDPLAGHLEEPLLAAAIAEAVQACPVLQVKEIFEALDSAIRRLCDSFSLADGKRSDKDDTASAALLVILRVAVLVFRNVRVDAGTASEIDLSCHSFVENSVTELGKLGRANRGGGNESSDGVAVAMTKVSLTLCGWCLDLHARCAFWLGRQAVLSIPKEVVKMLRSASKSVNQNKQSHRRSSSLSSREQSQWDDIAGELLFLSCQRLRQLHSLSFEQERPGLVDKEPEEEKARSSKSYASEASDLASFAVAMAMRQRGTSSLEKFRWTTIAEHFVVWIPYVNDRQVDWFLNWLFSVLSVDPTSPSLPPETVAYRKEYARINEDVGCAKALISDASFFESKKIWSRFGVAALSCCAEWVSWALTDCTTGDPMDDRELACLAYVGNPTGADQKVAWDVDDLIHLSQSTTIVETAGETLQQAVLEKLKRASEPIMLLNGLAAEGSAFDGDDVFDFIGHAINLEHVSRSLVEKCVKLLPTAMQLIGALRLSIANALKTVSFDGPERSLDMRSEHVHRLLLSFAETAVKLTSQHGEVDSEEAIPLLTGTSALVRELCRFVLPQCKQSHSLGWTVGLIVGHQQVRGDDVKQRAVAVLGRAFLDSLASHHSDDDNGDDASWLELRTTVRDHFWKVIEAANTHKQGNKGADLPQEIMLLFGDLLRYSAEWKLLPSSWLEPGARDALLYSLLDCELYAKDDPFSVHRRNSLCYFLASVARGSSSSDVSQSILDKIVAAHASDPLLDATFCHLIGTASAAVVKETLERLVPAIATLEADGISADNTIDATRHRIRLVSRLVTHADKDTCDSAVLAGYGTKILALSLSQLHHHTEFQDIPSSSATAVLVQACSLLEELIRRRDVLVFRERDLARVLSHLCAVVGPGPGGCSAAAIATPRKPLSTKVFVACTRVFVCMFQRYTKQLYACVPIVTLVLHSFLDRVLYEEEDPSGTINRMDILKRGQCLSRVCEMFIANKDIYKKHLLAPILEFVRALQTNLSLERKKIVLPAIYCLLDSLSTYEMQQLNALMDSKGKALFGTVYQTYQKLHAYKGR